MTTDSPTPMTADSVRRILEDAGARVMTRAGRTENYSAPREFSFEVKGIFANGMGLHVVARQFTYCDPWETQGRVNDRVDVSLMRDGSYTALPRGFAFFQQRDEEEGVEEGMLLQIVETVRELNPKIYDLQRLTGDF